MYSMNNYFITIGGVFWSLILQYVIFYEKYLWYSIEFLNLMKTGDGNFTFYATI